MRVGGQDIYVRQDGPRDAPALVLIHGLGGSTRWWDQVVPTLATNTAVISDPLYEASAWTGLAANTALRSRRASSSE